MEAKRSPWSFKLITFIKALWFAGGKAFVGPSAMIFFVETYQIWIVWRWTSCLNQWDWISIWLRLGCIFIAILTSSCIIYYLLHWILIALKRISNRNFINREKYIVSLAVCNTTRSFTSVEKVVIVFCLLALHAIESPNNFIL